MTFGQRLRTLRKKTGKRQTQVGQELGLSQTQISTWEQRLNPPAEATVRMFADYFGVAPGYFTELPPDDTQPTWAALYVRSLRKRVT